MKKISNYGEIHLGLIVVVIRDCIISNETVKRGTVGSFDELHGLKLKQFNNPKGFSIEYCNGDPRLRVAYKNERKLF